MPKEISVTVTKKKMPSSSGSLPMKMPVDWTGLIVQVPDAIASESAKERYKTHRQNRPCEKFALVPENIRTECQLGNHRRYCPEQDDREIGHGLPMIEKNKC